MGQAKQRGTFEQRKQQAIIRDTQKRKELERIRIEKWNALSQEEKDAIIKKQEDNRNFEMDLFGLLFRAAGLHRPDFFAPPKLKR